MSGNQEVTTGNFWCNEEGKQTPHFESMFFLNILQCHCRVLCHVVSPKARFLYTETFWKHIFLIFIIKYIKYQWTYKRLKSQWNPVANSIYAILGGATENQNKVLKKKHSSQLAAFVGVKH